MFSWLFWHSKLFLSLMIFKTLLYHKLLGTKELHLYIWTTVKILIRAKYELCFYLFAKLVKSLHTNNLTNKLWNIFCIANLIWTSYDVIKIFSHKQREIMWKNNLKMIQSSSIISVMSVANFHSESGKIQLILTS